MIASPLAISEGDDAWLSAGRAASERDRPNGFGS
jgi:hypothetical protein